MTKNHPIFFNYIVKICIFVVAFAFQAAIVRANLPERDVVSKNEAAAAQMSSVWNLESINQAINLFEQTAQDWENLGEPQRAAFCLNEAAKLTQVNSDYGTAFRILDKALRLETKNNLVEEKVVSLSLFSLISRQKGDKNNSQEYSKQALSLSRNGNSAKAQAYALFSSGMYEYYHGKLRNATVSFEQANGFAQQTQDIYLMSQVLYYVSYSYLREGNPSNAVDKMNLALRQCEEYNYQRGKALSYFGIGYLSYFLNEKQKALDIFKKSVSLFPADFEWLEKARTYNVIGQIYMDLGEFELAEKNVLQAIEDYEKVDYLFGKVLTLINLAEIYASRADFIKARKTYDTATELSLKIGDKFRLAIIKEGVGNIEFRENNYDNAIKNYLEALRTYNEIGVKIPEIENLLGNVYVKKKDPKTARSYYNSALQTTEQTRDFFQLSENLFDLSKLEAQESNLEPAINQIKQSLDLTETVYSDIFNSKLKSAFFSSVFDRYEHYINLLMKMHARMPDKDYSIQALQAAEKSRARAMLEKISLSEANVIKDADVEIVKREKEIRVVLNRKADELTDLLSQNAEKSETEKLIVEIRELENELETIKARLKEQSPIYSAIKNPAPFDVADFQQNILDDNSLLLEFSFGKEESYLWLVSKTEVSAYRLPPREEIESSIETLRALLQERELKPGESIEDYQRRIGEAEIKYLQKSKELSSLLFGQIAEKMIKKRLIIVPDGELYFFPVAALPLPDSDSDEPILLNNETVYEPSAQTLAVLDKSRRQSAATKNLLVFSDPVFSRDDARFSPENRPIDTKAAETVQTEKFRFVDSLNNLTRLAASKDESETIIKTLGASPADNYSGFRATRENLLNLKTEDYKILHFATHGFVKEEHPELSGIVLSRFDEKGQKLDEFFRIQDIYALNLNADLVVLSACETGIGKQIKGEGLMSLNNAFLQTGAKSVMASLWKVEDGATLELMKNFYGTLADQHLTPSEALRRAQMKLRENPQYKSPFYWAAFTMQGDFRSVPKLSSGSFGFWVYLVPVFPLALAGSYLYRRRKLAIAKTV
ncbi:MAG TPA: CHAT domain-containing protein [Pyrinomonadaceae bacterium]|jgi:CHAT domain-containing protein